MEIRNAVIKSVTITNDDHGCLSMWLGLDYGGTEQGFGGYALYSPSYKNIQKNYAGHFIWRCLEVGGVTEVSQLKGRNVRVKSDMSRIHSIGHIVKDVWFVPSEELKEMEEAS